VIEPYSDLKGIVEMIYIVIVLVLMVIGAFALGGFN